MTSRIISTLVLVAGLCLPAAASDMTRPEIVVADSASGCPSVEGAFVVLLDPARGMLLLSGAEFPGAHRAGAAGGGPVGVPLSGGGQWWLERAGSAEGEVGLWAARYPFLGDSGAGCVAFDRDRWSSEGDLVTYARWLVEEIYLELPAAERSRRPDLRLSSRELTIRVSRQGFGDLELTGKEGSTLACRYDDSGRLYLFMPFVLDEFKSRVAVKVMSTDGTYFDQESKTTIGWAVATPETPGALADTTFVIGVQSLADPK